jgi:hypothetical protein
LTKATPALPSTKPPRQSHRLIRLSMFCVSSGCSIGRNRGLQSVSQLRGSPGKLKPSCDYLPAPTATTTDLRFSKLLNLGPARLQAKFDIYNLLNQAAVARMNTFYGTFLAPARGGHGRAVVQVRRAARLLIWSTSVRIEVAVKLY